ncbi:prepilin peptidase [Micrococcoides hystricis]|uniref:Prepilin peptidase n=1 Tax=Micrococcoides hystricis TaxID=1572761 RepID=A0ABV6PA66_9MICC
MFVVLAWVLFVGASGWLIVHDIEEHKLPNRIIYPWFLATVAVLVLAALSSAGWANFGNALLGALAHLLIYLVLRLISKRAVGMGDVKLAAVLGLYLGWHSLILVPVAVFGAFLLGTLFSLAGMVAGKLTLKSRIPFGPMMIVATAAVTLAWHLGVA